ncbi:unnamed protein product [marine sediment metagenome]|uniref:Uncharacterized protein n=1 Tax=marine sediment metagenome TaxID=412755 RepID=X1VNZ6_9ZZZZ
MPEKIEIIHDYDGYKDPGIKDVELTRVNGYKTKIIKKEGKEMAEEYRLKNISAVDARRIIECADKEGIDIEKIVEFINKLKGGKIKMTDQKTDDERFTNT